LGWGGVVLVGGGKFFAVFVVGVGGVVVGPLWVSLSFCVNLRAFYLLSFVVHLIAIL